MDWLGYRRVSRRGDREGDRLVSPELQANRIRRYAESRGITVRMLDPEIDVSGGKLDRPILDEVIAAIERGEAAGIVVSQVDRLSRVDLVDALKTIATVEQAGGQVIAVAENFDAGTPEGRLGRNVFLSLAHMQLERSKIAFQDAKARAVKSGIWPAPTPPRGYTVTARKHGGDGRLRVDPEMAPKVVKAFEMAAGGATWSSIGEYLGCSVTGAQRLIHNRAYLGEINLGELRQPDTHEPLVTPDTFAAANLDRGRPARRGDREPALLAGLLRCAGCQRKMTPDLTPGDRIYRCHPRNSRGRCQAPAIVMQGKLDAYVTEIALAHMEEAAITASERGAAVDAAAQVLGAAEAERDAYQQVTRVTDIGADAFAAGMRSRVQAVHEARAELGRARARVGPLPAVGDIRAAWDDLSIEERRHFLRGSLGVVWVRKGRGPCAGRVRVVAAGFVPAGLPQSGRPAFDVVPLAWEADLEGEVRVTGPKDLL